MPKIKNTSQMETVWADSIEQQTDTWQDQSGTDKQARSHHRQTTAAGRRGMRLPELQGWREGFKNISVAALTCVIHGKRLLAHLALYHFLWPPPH